MPIAANHPRFTLALPGLDTELRVLAFQGREALSQPFAFELELVCTRPDLDLETLLQQPAALRLHGTPDRWIHGRISAAGQSACGRRFSQYQLRLTPNLHSLGLRRHVRVFQRQPVPDILRQLLREAGLQDFRLELGQAYPARARCAQYNETDLEFFHRLLREEGLHYWFEHFPDRHVLVLTDRERDFPALAPRALPFRNDAVMVGEPVILSFQQEWALTPDAVGLSDYDPLHPRRRLQVRAGSGGGLHGGYQAWPGRFEQLDDGERRARHWLRAEQSAGRQAHGQGRVHWLEPGRVMSLDPTPVPLPERDYLVLEVEHWGRQPQVLEEEGQGVCQYANQFLALPASQPLRPAPARTRPRALPQTAWATGRPGEAIHSDHLGRIAVRFHWQPKGEDVDGLRVLQAWAGAGWGSLILPRVGQEVLVVFLDEDPDRPLVCGALYHRLQRRPQRLPDHGSRSLLRSRNLAAERGHELLLEDRAGQERIRLYSTGDLLLQVRRNRRARIEGETRETIGGNRLIQIRGDAHDRLGGERRVRIQGSDFRELKQALHLKAGGIRISGGGDLHLKAGLEALLEAGVELTLKVGASHVRLHPGGLALQAPLLHLAGGGAAAAAAPAELRAPGRAARIGSLERPPRG